MQHLERHLTSETDILRKERMGKRPATERTDHLIAAGNQDGVGHASNMRRGRRIRESVV